MTNNSFTPENELAVQFDGVTYHVRGESESPAFRVCPSCSVEIFLALANLYHSLQSSDLVFYQVTPKNLYDANGPDMSLGFITGIIMDPAQERAIQALLRQMSIND